MWIFTEETLRDTEDVAYLQQKFTTVIKGDRLSVFRNSYNPELIDRETWGIAWFGKHSSSSSHSGEYCPFKVMRAVISDRGNALMLSRDASYYRQLNDGCQ